MLLMLQLAKAMHSSDRSSATSLRSRGLIKGGLIKGVDAKRQARPQPANLSRTMRPPGEHRRISSRSTPRDAWAQDATHRSTHAFGPDGARGLRPAHPHGKAFVAARLAALAEALAGAADDADAWALPLLPAAEAALVLRGFSDMAAPFPAGHGKHGKHGKPTVATRTSAQAHRAVTPNVRSSSHRGAVQGAPPSLKARSSTPTVATRTPRLERAHAHAAKERSAEFSWDALNVTTIMCGVEKCYFPSQREGEGWLVGKQHR